MNAAVVFAIFLAVATETSRMVSGTVANPGQFPWQLQLKSHGEVVCGAVLISENRALTAAHCLSDQYDYSVTAGAYSMSFPSGQEITLHVASYIKHPEFQPDSNVNDIAILKLGGHFPMNPSIGSIELAYMGAWGLAGATCTVSGWGLASGGGSYPSPLEYEDLPVIPNGECQSRLSNDPDVNINPGHICTYGQGKSACAADSGGPLVCFGFLAGITSRDITSCEDDSPALFTGVSDYAFWIAQNM